MNAGRWVLASVVVFVVRTLMNMAVYGYAFQGRFEEMKSAHPGIFREVIPAYITLDLIIAFLLTYMVAKAASAFGAGVKGGVALGLLVALLGPVFGGLYNYFSVTYIPSDFYAIDSVYQLVAHAIQGAVAAALYYRGT